MDTYISDPLLQCSLTAQPICTACAQEKERGENQNHCVWSRRGVYLISPFRGVSSLSSPLPSSAAACADLPRAVAPSSCCLRRALTDCFGVLL
uniref:Uncharacterized protein n=1 Tax=Leersia perrieri TaxID=77586 RepID=A0A0D9VS04_9ORYZ